MKKAVPAKAAVPAKKAVPVTAGVATKATPAKKAPAPKPVSAKKDAPITKAAPAKKTAPAKKSAPVKKAAAATEAAPVKKAAAATKAAPVNKAAVATKGAPAKKAVPVTKAAPVKKAAAATKVAPAKKAAPAKTAAKATSVRPAASPRAGRSTAGSVKKAATASEPPPLTGGDAWSDAELAEVRAELEVQAKALRGEIVDAEEQDAALKRDSGGEGTGDEADAGSKTFEREHEMSLANNSRDLLMQVERALSRLDGATYGRCENCGKPIPKARLQALPAATMCMACKRREERR